MMDWSFSFSKSRSASCFFKQICTASAPRRIHMVPPRPLQRQPTRLGGFSGDPGAGIRGVPKIAEGAAPGVPDPGGRLGSPLRFGRRPPGGAVRCGPDGGFIVCVHPGSPRCSRRLWGARQALRTALLLFFGDPLFLFPPLPPSPFPRRS